MDRWGPVHHCHGGCGDEVQYRRYKLFNAGTLERHRCRLHPDGPAAIVFVECLCGRDVDVVDRVRYDHGTLRPHTCDQPAVPPAVETPRPRVRRAGDIAV